MYSSNHHLLSELVIHQKSRYYNNFFTDLAARTVVSPRHIVEGRQNTRKQSANTVRTREVEEEIGVQRIIKDPGAATRETETKDVTVPAQADHTLRIVQEEKLGPRPERNHEALLAVPNRINQK